MSAQLLIRPYAENDAAAVAMVHVRTWQQAYQGIMDPELLAALDVDSYKKRWQEGYARYRNDPTRGTLVAVTNNEIFGFLSYGPARDEGVSIPMEIYAINILRPYWGIGVGHALFDTARTKLRALRERQTYLWVLADNHRARDAYTRWGGNCDAGHEKTITLGGQDLREIRFDFKI